MIKNACTVALWSRMDHRKNLVFAKVNLLFSGLSDTILQIEGLVFEE